MSSYSLSRKQVVLMVAQVGMSAKSMGRIAKDGGCGDEVEDEDNVVGGGASAVLVVVAGSMFGFGEMGAAMLGVRRWCECCDVMCAGCVVMMMYASRLLARGD